jgi:alkylated DNA nucleotide flippase Atl1
MLKVEIKNRWDDAVIFSADVDADENTPNSILLRLAVLAAIEAKADLRSADLRSADLRYADLRYADLRYADLRSANLSSADLRYADLSSANLSSADLRYADLSSANLSSADLRYADLRSADLRSANLSSADLRYADPRSADLRVFKADLWMTLTQNRHEVSALITALREGKVDGSTYQGDCACLVGTIANAAHVDYATLDHNSSNPAERWFAMIRNGDKPGDDTGGGFASKMALEWSLEWLALNGMADTETAAVE